MKKIPLEILFDKFYSKIYFREKKHLRIFWNVYKNDFIEIWAKLKINMLGGSGPLNTPTPRALLDWISLAKWLSGITGDWLAFLNQARKNLHVPEN